jgi:hypothetical protein
LDLRGSHIVNQFFYLIQEKNINEIYEIIVKTLDVVFDLGLKVKIVKEKTASFSTEKTRFFSSKNGCRNNEWAVQMIFLRR